MNNAIPCHVASRLLLASDLICNFQHHIHCVRHLRMPPTEPAGIISQKSYPGSLDESTHQHCFRHNTLNILQPHKYRQNMMIYSQNMYCHLSPNSTVIYQDRCILTFRTPRGHPPSPPLESWPKASFQPPKLAYVVLSSQE